MKFHIIECNSKITFEEFISTLVKDSIDHFLNIKFDNITLTATFYKEIKRTEKTVDKDGKENLISFDYYLYQGFSFHNINNRLFLVVNEPNKHTKHFLEFIHSIFRMKISFINKQIDLKSFIVKAKKLNHFHVLKARFNELPLSKNSKGSLEVTSTENAILDFEKIFGDIYYDLAKVKFSYLDEVTYTIELSKNGLIFASKNSELRLKTVSKLIALLFFI
ncbi:hypothetical protein [Acinetobacter lwoffii]|uniref:hypothetical protein n=2 Tax=Acinetobacter lwoffii TaxID=28090 RepID=UPI0021CD242F|nr:hypothetical protein [Acinetobacter lwoffii]MCU4420437.1 hypothetical protein [Acinetobacter lwoffii]